MNAIMSPEEKLERARLRSKSEADVANRLLREVAAALNRGYGMLPPLLDIQVREHLRERNLTDIEGRKV